MALTSNLNNNSPTWTRASMKALLYIYTSKPILPLEQSMDRQGAGGQLDTGSEHTARGRALLRHVTAISSFLKFGPISTRNS